ncbi:hypothetical protein, partial [Pseudoalteromonas sp.]|uniref:hypothetical protein n=1 Tax=Pseudoalteromonas sp. TaxID=53249 RepID=UPI0026133E92
MWEKSEQCQISSNRDQICQRGGPKKQVPGRANANGPPASAFPRLQYMLTLLAVSSIAQANLFDTTSWFGTLIPAQSLLTCMS